MTRLISPAAGRIVRHAGESPDHEYLVLCRDGVDVAQVSVWDRENAHYIEHVHTMPTHRRRGYATRLLVALFDRHPGRTFELCASAFEFPGLVAEHPAPNTATLTAWYGRLGFRPHGIHLVRPGVPENNRADVPSRRTS